MVSVTGQGNNRAVYTNNKTVTLFLVQTFIWTFVFSVLKRKKKLLYRTKSMHNSPFYLYSEMIKKRKRGKREKVEIIKT